MLYVVYGEWWLIKLVLTGFGGFQCGVAFWRTPTPLPSKHPPPFSWHSLGCKCTLYSVKPKTGQFIFVCAWCIVYRRWVEERHMLVSCLNMIGCLDRYVCSTKTKPSKVLWQSDIWSVTWTLVSASIVCVVGYNKSCYIQSRFCLELKCFVNRPCSLSKNCILKIVTVSLITIKPKG